MLCNPRTECGSMFKQLWTTIYTHIYASLQRKTPNRRFICDTNTCLVILSTDGIPPCVQSGLPREPRQPSQPSKPANPANAVETSFCFSCHCIYRLQEIDRPSFSSHSKLFFANINVSPTGSTFCLENTATAGVPLPAH